MIDIPTQINAIQRQVDSQTVESGEVVRVLLRREYRAAVDDVWHAVTDPDRMRRWFMPVSGDLREGGDFQLEGNASGRILRCDPPRLLRTTFGAETSIVEVRLSSEGGDVTTLELEHSVPIEMAGSGAGALYVGPGWDGALMGLGLYLAGHVPEDPVEAANAPETVEFNRHSVRAWTTIVEESGTAGPDDIAAAVQMSLAQFAPEDAAAPETNGKG